MVSAWAHRMQYMWEAEQQGLLDDPAMAAAVMAGYEPPPDFTALMDAGNQTIKAEGPKAMPSIL